MMTTPKVQAKKKKKKFVHSVEWPLKEIPLEWFLVGLIDDIMYFRRLRYEQNIFREMLC